ncbi:hypothetical protein [Candidatus Jettenia sp. AMX1]|nr:hypothetical protein [Candidatus Jettenia sp. AMX1]WKZ14773.1 MAG: hypothetical protein QY317_12805 [Candidatus Jettenia caeni]
MARSNSGIIPPQMNMFVPGEKDSPIVAQLSLIQTKEHTKQRGKTAGNVPILEFALLVEMAEE